MYEITSESKDSVMDVYKLPLLVGYVGEPMGYFCCVFPLVEFCFFSGFGVDVVKTLLSSSLLAGFMRWHVGWLYTSGYIYMY